MSGLYPKVGRRFVWIACVFFALFGSLGTVGALMGLAQARSPVPPPAKTGSEVTSFIQENPNYAPPGPPKSQLWISAGVSFVFACAGWGGFLLRRRRAGLWLQRGLGFALTGNVLFVPFAMNSPLAWSPLAVLIIGMMGVGILLSTFHPGPDPAPATN